MRKVTLFCAATLFSLLSFAQDNNADIVKVGDSMPAFTLHSTVNGTVNSEDLKGKVVLTFLVNKEGRPFYIKVKESLCESADKEAIRLIQEGPDWIYGNKLAEVTVKFE